jgi:hypothetical protein
MYFSDMFSADQKRVAAEAADAAIATVDVSLGKSAALQLPKPSESEIDLAVTRPAHALVRVGAVKLSLRWQVRADSRGDTDGEKVVSIRPGIQDAHSLQQSSTAREIEALFELMNWRVAFEAVAATGEIWARAECD